MRLPTTQGAHRAADSSHRGAGEQGNCNVPSCDDRIHNHRQTARRGRDRKTARGRQRDYTPRTHRRLRRLRMCRAARREHIRDWNIQNHQPHMGKWHSAPKIQTIA